MTMTRRITPIALLLLAFLASPPLAPPPHAQSAPRYAVVVNRENPIQNLTMADLRKIFLGEKRFWSGSKTIKVLIRTGGSPERQATLHALEMSELDYKKHWLEKVNAGEADAPPAEVFSNGAIVSLVSGSLGAIAIVAVADVRDTVKVLRIEGQLPDQPGYPIQ